MLAAPKIPPLERYCHGCSVEHFPKDCLLKPTDPTIPKNPATLNILTVIPSPTTSETENEPVPVRVITRAQEKKLQNQAGRINTKAKETLEQPNDKEKSSKKKIRSQRRKKSKSKTSSDEENPIPKELERVLKPKADPKEQIEANTNEPIQLQGVLDSEKDSGGSILVEKLNEPLDATLHAYESRITALTELPKKL